MHFKEKFLISAFLWKREPSCIWNDFPHSVTPLRIICCKRNSLDFV